jgi:hypothetical protein
MIYSILAKCRLSQYISTWVILGFWKQYELDYCLCAGVSTETKHLR